MNTMKYPPGFIEETLRIVINNINDDREYLGLQLGLAQGLISERTYKKERVVYLIRSKFSHIDLVERSKILKKLIGDRLDSEIIKTAFRCTIEEADAVFLEIQDASNI
jgi:hypothetical protein